MEKTEIIGNLTRDPEMRVTQNGVSVCSFTVAVNQRPSKAQREKGEQPPAKFFKVTAWRDLGENCGKYLAKGRKVYVDGVIGASCYVSEKDGKAYASLELTANNVEFLSSKGEGSPIGGADNPLENGPATVQNPSGFTPVETDELPF